MVVCYDLQTCMSLASMLCVCSATATGAVVGGAAMTVGGAVALIGQAQFISVAGSCVGSSFQLDVTVYSSMNMCVNMHMLCIKLIRSHVTVFGCSQGWRPLQSPTEHSSL